MSQELINAAIAGNLNQVKRLSENPSTNLNFIGQMNRPNFIYNVPDTVQVTALIAALMYRHREVALFLLSKGARVEMDDTEGTRSYKTVFLNAVVTTAAEAIDLDIIKIILMKCTVLNPIYIYTSVSGAIPHLKRLRSSTFCPIGKNRITVANYFFYEAVLRNDHDIMNFCLAPYEEDSKCTVTPEALIGYIGNRTFTAAQVFNAKNGVDFLFDKKLLTLEAAELVKKIIDERYIVTFDFEVLPRQLQKSLKKLSNRSLHELFAELQSWLYPEEVLPKFIVTKETRFEIDEYPKTIDEIQNWQDPISLRTFLSMDIISILERLYYSGSENVESPAVVLLAEIALRFGDVKIKIDGKEEPLLNMDLKKYLLQVFIHFYNLNDIEKLLLNSSRRKDIALLELKAQNDQLCNAVERLDKQNNMIASEMQSLNAKLDKLLSLSMSRSETTALDETSRNKRPESFFARPKT